VTKQEKMERALENILSVFADYRDGFATPELALDAIQKVAAGGLERQVCRSCKKVFEPADYYNCECSSCATKRNCLI